MCCPQARHCLDFGKTLQDVERNLFPNKTCEFMFQLSQLFSKFYSACSVGDAGCVAARLRDQRDDATCLKDLHVVSLGLPHPPPPAPRGPCPPPHNGAVTVLVPVPVPGP